MRFCMITTFFGPHSFGGDAAYVDRLSRALLRRGHEVDVVYCMDAFEAVGRRVGSRVYDPPEGLRLQRLRSRFGLLSPLWTHQTGGLGPKTSPVADILARDYDVVHLHNVSLVGGPALIEAAADRSGVTLMTAHEFWLVCPLSTLWKFDREVCERPECFRCTLAARRPPQLWRQTPKLERAVARLDALLFPSDFARARHSHLAGIVPQVTLPYFLPDDWASPGARSNGARPTGERPYFAAAGRLVKAKGFERLVRMFERLPDVDLRIAGIGPLEPALRRLAARVPNVRLEGQLGPTDIEAFFRGARAVVVPSSLLETFGYVVAEAYSAGAPVIVSDAGALPEIVERSGGGIVCRTDDEFLQALRRLATDDALRADLAARGRETVKTIWSEQAHADAYFSLIERCSAP
jgi:glycosyltransferase involved in cell wall biosynthesis